MSLPIGVSGTSLALSIFNATQILSIKKQLDDLSTTPTQNLTILENDIEVQTPEIQPVQVVDEVEPLEETEFTATTSEETFELQTKVSELERFANSVNTRSIQNTNNVSIKGDELDRLSSFVTDSLVAVRERVSSSENGISVNQSNVGINTSSISDLTEQLSSTNGRVDLSILNISDLGSSVTGLQQRMDASESNNVELSSQITDVVLAADATGDNVSLLDEILVDTKESLESVIESMNNFNSIAFVADSKLQVSSLEAAGCNLSFRHNEAEISALHWTSSLTNGSWSSFLANTSGKAPDGTAASSFGDVTSWALRTRLGGGDREGIIIETGTGDGVFSVSARGILDIGNARIAPISGNATFGNSESVSKTGFSIMQDSSGKTQVNSSSGQNLLLCNNGTVKCRVETDTSLTIKNNIGENVTSDTHFNYNNLGENYIRTAVNKATVFSFGKNSPSVYVTDKEVTVSGVALRATIASLQSRIEALEAKEYVLNGTKLRLRNGNNNKLARKATSNDSMIVDSTTKDSRSQWEVNLI